MFGPVSTQGVKLLLLTGFNIYSVNPTRSPQSGLPEKAYVAHSFRTSAKKGPACIVSRGAFGGQTRVFSLFYTVEGPANPGLSQGQTRVCPLGKPGAEGRHRKFMSKKFMCLFRSLDMPIHEEALKGGHL